MFGSVVTGGRIERLGVLNLNVTGLADVGGLAGSDSGAIGTGYATGSVAGTPD